MYMYLKVMTFSKAQLHWWLSLYKIGLTGPPTPKKKIQIRLDTLQTTEFPVPCPTIYSSDPDSTEYYYLEWKALKNQPHLFGMVFKEHLQQQKLTMLQVRISNHDPKMTHTLHLTITQHGHISMQFDPLQIWSVNRKRSSRSLPDHSVGYYISKLFWNGILFHYFISSTTIYNVNVSIWMHCIFLQWLWFSYLVRMVFMLIN